MSSTKTAQIKIKNNQSNVKYRVQSSPQYNPDKSVKKQNIVKQKPSSVLNSNKKTEETMNDNIRKFGGGREVVKSNKKSEHKIYLAKKNGEELTKPEPRIKVHTTKLKSDKDVNFADGQSKIIRRSDMTKVVNKGQTYMLDGKMMETYQNGKPTQQHQFKTKSLVKGSEKNSKNSSLDINDLSIVAHRGGNKKLSHIKNINPNDMKLKNIEDFDRIVRESVFIEDLLVNTIEWKQATGPLPTNALDVQNIYLSTTGDDENTGLTEELAVASFSRAVQVANGYDNSIINIEDGMEVDTGSETVLTARAKITVKGTRSVSLTTTATGITPDATYDSNTIIDISDVLTPNELTDQILSFTTGIETTNYFTVISNTANTITIAGNVDLGALNETFEVYVPNVKIFPTDGTDLTLNGKWIFTDVVIGNDTDNLIIGNNSSINVFGSSITINIQALTGSYIELLGSFLFTQIVSPYEATWSLVNCIIDEITELQIWDSTITMMGCYVFNTSLVFQNCNINMKNSELSAGVNIILTQICHLILDNCILAYDLLTTDTISCSNSRMTLLNNITFVGNVVNAISLVDNSTAIVSDSAILHMDVITGNIISLNTGSNIIFGSNATFTVNSPAAIDNILLIQNGSNVLANSDTFSFTPATVNENIINLGYNSNCDLNLSTFIVSPVVATGGFLINNNSQLSITAETLTINLLGVNIFTVSNNSKLSIYNPSGTTCNALLNSDQILFDVSFNSHTFIDAIVLVPEPGGPVVLTVMFNIHFGSSLTIVSVAGLNAQIPAAYTPTDTYILGGLAPSGTVAIPGQYLNDFSAGTPEGCFLVAQP